MEFSGYHSYFKSRKNCQFSEFWRGIFTVLFAEKFGCRCTTIFFINREQAEEILLQDDFDSSRNNDDIDDAEVHEIIGNSSVSCDNHLE